MNENPKQYKGFQEFITSGAVAHDDAFRSIAKACGVSLRTVWRWYKKNNWRARADQILLEVSREPVYTPDPDEEKEQINEETRKRIREMRADVKLKMQADIDDAVIIIMAGFATGIEYNPDGTMTVKFRITKASDVAALATALEKLYKLKLLTLGEDTDHDVINVTFRLPDDLDPDLL